MTIPNRKLRVFICHASQDKSIVRELYQQLLTVGWIDPWLDEEKLLPGQEWNIEIEKAVASVDAVIVCLSSNSISRQGYIQKELRLTLDIALEKPEGSIFIIPLRIEECQPPRVLRAWQYLDYFPPQAKEISVQKLLRSLRFLGQSLRILSSKDNDSADGDFSDQSRIVRSESPLRVASDNLFSQKLNSVEFTNKLFGSWKVLGIDDTKSNSYDTKSEYNIDNDGMFCSVHLKFEGSGRCLYILKGEQAKGIGNWVVRLVRNNWMGRYAITSHDPNEPARIRFEMDLNSKVSIMWFERQSNYNLQQNWELLIHFTNRNTIVVKYPDEFDVPSHPFGKIWIRE